MPDCGLCKADQPLDESGNYHDMGGHVRQKCMREPAGSGALREALEKAMDALERIRASQRIVGALVVQDMEGAICKGRAALSLSSPIERCPTCTSSVKNIKAGLAYGVLEPGKCPDIWHGKRINPDSPEFRAGDSYGMERVFQQLTQYLETGTCECQQVVEFAVRLEGKFRS